MSRAGCRRPRRAAPALAFGGVERYREATRAARGFPAVSAVARDSQLAVRRLHRTPAFTLGVMATLAVGLGAAAGIGALVYGVMLRPLPYPDSGRLVLVSLTTPGLGITTTEQSAGTFLYFAERARSFSALGAAMENEGVAITEGDAPEQVTGAIVTPNIFGILGTTPAAGRLFVEGDGSDEHGPVLISYALWQRRFGGHRDVAGQSIELNRRRRPIVGVLPPGFGFPSRNAAVYYPDRIEATQANLGDRYLTVVGRLAPGVSVAQAQAEADLLVPRLPERFPELSADALRRAGLRMTVRPRPRAGTPGSPGPTAAATLGGTAFRSWVTGAASSVTIFMMICCAEAPVWGGFPVSISYSTLASE